MAAGRRTVAIVFLAIGTVGLFASILGIVVGLRVLGALEDSIASTLDATADTVERFGSLADDVAAFDELLQQFGREPLMPDGMAIDPGLIDRAAADLDAQLGQARWLLVGTALGVAVLQIVPLWLGWVLIDVRRLHAVLELRPPPGDDG